MHWLQMLLHLAAQVSISIWHYIADPSKLRSSVGDKLIGALFGSMATIWTYTKTRLWTRLLSAWRYVTAVLLGRRYILIWLDAEVSIGHRLSGVLGAKCPDSEVRLLSAPKDILSYPLQSRITEALVFLNTDVTKLSLDDKIRKQLDSRIKRYLARGGGIVAAHDVIYRRTRNTVLKTALGGDLVRFQNTSDPVKYRRVSDHPIARQIGTENLSLHDGELLWSTWDEEAQVVYASDDSDQRPLVVAKSHGGRGRLVWLHSCDQQSHLAKAIRQPEPDFIKLLNASITWVSGHSLRLDAYPYVVAHRGAPENKRENTVASFEEAVKQGADFIECDIRMTKDGFCILSHDPFVGSAIIADSMLDQVLAAGHQIGVDIATLEQFLIAFRNTIRADFEIKEYGCEKKVLELIASKGWGEGSYVITSFIDDSIRAVKDIDPSVRCGLLLGKEHPSKWLETRFSELFPIGRLKRCSADFVAPHHKLLTLGFSRRVTSAGFQIWVWTVNDPRLIGRLMRTRRIEAVVTDFISRGLDERRKFHAVVSGMVHSHANDEED